MVTNIFKPFYSILFLLLNKRKITLLMTNYITHNHATSILLIHGDLSHSPNNAISLSHIHTESLISNQTLYFRNKITDVVGPLLLHSTLRLKMAGRQGRDVNSCWRHNNWHHNILLRKIVCFCGRWRRCWKSNKQIMWGELILCGVIKGSYFRNDERRCFLPVWDCYCIDLFAV